MSGFRWSESARNALGLLALPVALLCALPALVVALPFVLVAGATRWVQARLSRDAAEWHELIRYDPEIGWAPKPDLRAHHLDVNGDAYVLSTDGSGWRDADSTLVESDILVYGDSFAFGFAIDDADFFGKLGGEAGIKAIGAPGYNMVQTLLLMERHATRLEGKLVVWLVYPGNDLDDNLRPSMERWRMPFVREGATEGDWEIVREHVDRDEWPFPGRIPSSETFLEICTPGTHLSRRALGACAHLIRRARDVCSAAGARLAVMTIPDLSPLAESWNRDALAKYRAPDRFDPEYPSRRISEICDELGVPFRSLREDLSERDYRRHDVHWTPRGHRRVAAALRDLHRAADTGGRRTEPTTVERSPAGPSLATSAGG